jgi:pimeloyl-ACP methyl ester carboxylesterase
MRTLHAATLREMVLSAAHTDLHPRLAELQRPLLIISGRRDAFAPTHTVGLKMHAAAPGSQLVVMDDGTHGSLFGHAGYLVSTIDRFLDERGVR